MTRIFEEYAEFSSQPAPWPNLKLDCKGSYRTNIGWPAGDLQKRGALRLGNLTSDDTDAPDAGGFTFGLFRLVFWAISPELQAASSHALAALVEHQPVEVVGQVAMGQFCFGTGQADRADEQPEPVLLMGKDMFDVSAD